MPALASTFCNRSALKIELSPHHADVQLQHFGATGRLEKAPSLTGLDRQAAICLPINGRATLVGHFSFPCGSAPGAVTAGLAPSFQRGVMKCGRLVLYHIFATLALRE